MNALFYAPQMAAYGGMERHVCTLASVASLHGHAVTLLTTSNSLGPELRAELANARVVLRELPAARQRASKFLKLRWLLSEIVRCRRQSWDLIYTNGQSALARVVWHASGRQVRRIHHHHTAADTSEQNSWSSAYRHVLQRAPELIACSCATRDALNLTLGRTDACYLPYLTRCPVDLESVVDRPADNTLHFGFMGRLVAEKGISTICRLSTDPSLADITWHIHGSGPDFPPEYFRPWPHVVYHGAFTDTAAQAKALLSLDAMVLFSTHNEGMPVSLIEGMSAGLPWIATDRGGTRELAISPPNSIVVPHPASDNALRVAVDELAWRIRTLVTSRTAQRRAFDYYFSPSSVSARWLRFLEAGPNTKSPFAPPVVR